ncbi:PilW family protein [Marinospirillum insulare]|uniref:Prepilin-type N-terminal cleavage/methylation domain-containing protein n=1 Tax=Marinospirillum insulare TaxID=217169 RepID=A0ABQ6A4W8_9GAMM|nr:type II secretion system protein [Marinospirillum insulare]GLR65135.1 hypothetical protein GCM10007878_25740 [Marinospirillum insulare]
MQKGFSLVEMLVASLFSGLILLSASQGLATLIKFQTNQSELVRLQERSNLAETALKNAIYQAQNVLTAGAATANYPNFSQQTRLLGYPKNSPINFNQFASSDWLLLSTGQSTKKRSLFHLDKKTYGFGLAFKDFRKATPRSDTLVNQVELVRFRFFCQDSQSWISASEARQCSQKISSVGFSVLLASSLAVSKTQANQFTLWGKQYAFPKDGRLRQVVSATVQLAGGSK